MFKTISTTVLALTILAGSFGLQKQCSAQYDLQAQDYTLRKTSYNQWELSGYIRNVSTWNYRGSVQAGAVVYMTIYYPQYKQYQYLEMKPLDQDVVPYPTWWLGWHGMDYQAFGSGYRHNFMDYEFKKTFSPWYKNTDATVMVMVWDKRNTPGDDIDLSNWIVGGYHTFK